MQAVAPRIGFTFAGSRKPPNRRQPSRIARVANSPQRVFLRYRIQRSLVAFHDPAAAFGMARVLDKLAIGSGHERPDAAIKANGTARGFQGQRIAFALEHGIPPAVALDHERPAVLWDLAPLAQPHRADHRNAHTILARVQMQSTVAVGELQLPPACCCPKARVSRSFALPQSAKERSKREIEPVQHRVLALPINGGEARILRPQRCQFGVLTLRGDADAAGRPDVTALLERGVVELARDVKRKAQAPLLPR